MSNRITLQRTRFTNLTVVKTSLSCTGLTDEPEEQNETFGYRLYDDEDAIYDNTLSADDLVCDDSEFLKKVRKNAGYRVIDLLVWAGDHGMYIDDNWYAAKWVNAQIGDDYDPFQEGGSED